jgi:hypothetical protein
MIDNNSESTTTVTTTFRFASGQVLSLDEDQIAKIPYLTAMVSSADRFESARDEDGHYKLDPHINYQHFSFILKSLTFHSVRQLFTRLPKQTDVISIIALLDFLGLGPQPDPTLNEIDSTFFSTVVYSPFLEKHIRLVKLCNIQDMAVQFGIAMAKEEYDFTKCEVIDQIYWFVMFILSAPKWFGSHLRHHVYKIAEHIFILFKPALLKSLKKLKHRSKKEARKFLLTTDKQNFDSNEENNSSITETLDWDLDYHDQLDKYSHFWLPRRRLEERQGLLLHRIYRSKYDNWFWRWRAAHEEDLLEPVYRRTLEIMYERLQTLVCRNAVAELRQKTIPYDFVQRRIHLPLSFYLSECEVLPKRMDNIFKDEFVQEEIHALILEELCILTPKLERKHAELLKRIREFEQDSETSYTYMLFNRIFFSFGYLDFETMQEEALSHELVLNKLNQNANIIVEQIQRRVLDGLRKVALEQFKKWANIQRDIDELCCQLNSCPQSEKSLCIASKTVHQQYQIPVHKPLLKRQFKYSTR